MYKDDAYYTKEQFEEYLHAKEQLAFWKKKELAHRLEILEEIFEEGALGTVNAYHEGYDVKGTFKNTLSLNAKALEEVSSSLTQAEKMCLVYKPSINLSEYNDLEPEQRELLDECITVKPALPTLTIKANED